MRIKPERIPHYAWDCAGCSCEPTHAFHGVPCIAVRRNMGRDRCLACGARWPSIEYRHQRWPTIVRVRTRGWEGWLVRNA